MEDSIEISLDVRESFPDDWPEWVLISLTELAATEEIIAESPLVQSLPDWAANMLEEIIKPMLPSIKWEADGQTGPEFLGKLIGHQEYLLESEEAGNALDQQVAKSEENSRKIDAYREKHLSDDQNQALEVIREEIAEYWMSGFELLEEVVEQKSEAIKRCRERAFSQPFEAAQEFNKAYSGAQSISLYNDQGNIDGLSNWNKIHVTLLIYKPLVENRHYFRTLPDLHKWIIRIYGYKIISFASFKQLCRESGLKLANRGRPKKR